MDYLISDLHLDHDNIIDYCDRPFGSVEEMNETLVESVGSGYYLISDRGRAYLAGNLDTKQLEEVHDNSTD